jgi:hypothetical protein
MVTRAACWRRALRLTLRVCTRAGGQVGAKQSGPRAKTSMAKLNQDSSAAMKHCASPAVLCISWASRRVAL